jgi:ethanolamine utilization protein EutN
MHLARVIGTLVATQKYEGMEGVKLLLIQPLDKRQQPAGQPLVAADSTAQAGPGELVFFIASREAALTLPTTFVPVDHAIVGIVDDVGTLVDWETGRLVSSSAILPAATR